MNDLRFTPDEAAAFLNEVMGLEISTDDVSALAQRTEGWIAGLQLAALSLQGREDIAEVIGFLNRLLAAAEEKERTGSIIKILVVLALTHEAQGDIAAATL